MEPIAKIAKATNRNINEKHPLFTHFRVSATIKTDSSMAPIE